MFKSGKEFGVFFHLKKSKKISSVRLPVYLHITINGSVTELSTKWKHSQLRWNKNAGKAEGETNDENRSILTLMTTKKGL